jgi:hypothetical protein
MPWRSWSSDLPSRRETCICEMPNRSAICVCVLVAEEARQDDGALPFGQLAEQGPQGLPLDHVLEVRVLGAEAVDDEAGVGLRGAFRGRVQRQRVVGVPRDDGLGDLLQADPEQVGELAGRGRAAVVLREPLGGVHQPGAHLLDAARDPDAPGPVPEVPPHFSEDDGIGVGVEAVAAVVVEPVDRRHQAEVGDLPDVLQRLAAVRVAPRDRLDHGGVRLDEHGLQPVPPSGVGLGVVHLVQQHLGGGWLGLADGGERAVPDQYLGICHKDSLLASKFGCGAAQRRNRLWGRGPWEAAVSGSSTGTRRQTRATVPDNGSRMVRGVPTLAA